MNKILFYNNRIRFEGTKSWTSVDTTIQNSIENMETNHTFFISSHYIYKNLNVGCVNLNMECELLTLSIRRRNNEVAAAVTVNAVVIGLQEIVFCHLLIR